MDNLRNVIKILFRYTSPMEVISNNTKYSSIAKNSFMVLANEYMSHYSNDEIENMLEYLRSEFEWHNNKIRGQEIIDEETLDEEIKVNVFDALLLFADSVLIEENGKPLCRYENILRWREAVVELDEDLFVTSFLAQKDLLNHYNRTLFFWSPVIGHNNKELNRLMEQGVAENHFHLKGSAPTFHLSWISLMNDVLNLEFKNTLDEYEKRRLNIDVLYQNDIVQNSLYISYLQAALIRVYLFAYLKDDYFTLRTTYIKLEYIYEYIENMKDIDEGIKARIERKDQEDYIDIDELRDCLPASIYKKIKQSLMQTDIKTLLLDSKLMLFYLPNIQKIILRLKEDYAPNQLDYTICFQELAVNPDRNLNELLSGERWFLYEMFQLIYKNGNKLFHPTSNLFYAYLLIKEKIRAELIQVNRKVGFNNFLLYQDRKENFIDGTLFEKPYLRMAVRDTILNQHIKILEARIAPKDSAEGFRNAIRKNDDCILAGYDEENKVAFQKKFFYVCHFIKSKDKIVSKRDIYIETYRHYEKRQQVKRQAQALYECRRKYFEEAERILGIDAASEEIVCRPEVFAQAYRFLKNDSVIRLNYNGEYITLPDLAVTYHAGEDFLDVIDGLRAIDEAISFLNLDCGDRLGHALALGVSVDDWYSSKANSILISQMEYLDNLVWLYAKIRKYRIEGCEDTVRYIEKRYNEYFRIVYLNNMSQKYFESVVDKAQKYYTEKEIKHNYINTHCYFSINTYYDSWKLRGDNPEYFKEGFFILDILKKDEWEEQGINKLFPENYRIRYNPEAAYLYHTYHYNNAVRLEGNKKVEIKINPSIKKAVKKVQKRMQLEIAQRGICIETNPSSNALIGTFRRYDKHPILNWYNIGLATNSDEIQNVPQIQVSVNTDDQGVFATYIENEYAYLALALEKMKDENGNPKYSRTVVYQWLDNIRKMGLSQSFAVIEN